MLSFPISRIYNDWIFVWMGISTIIILALTKCVSLHALRHCYSNDAEMVLMHGGSDLCGSCHSTSHVGCPTLLQSPMLPPVPIQHHSIRDPSLCTVRSPDSCSAIRAKLPLGAAILVAGVLDFWQFQRQRTQNWLNHWCKHIGGFIHLFCCVSPFAAWSAIFGCSSSHKSKFL